MRDVSVYSYQEDREVLLKKCVCLSDVIPDGSELQAKAIAYLDMAGRYWLGGHDDQPLFLLMNA